MADENILKIGAIVDLSTFLPSMEQMTATTRAATGAMGTSFQQLAVTTASSTAQMTTAFISVPAAAQIIPPAVRKVEVETEGATSRMGSQWTGLAGTIRSAAVSITESLSEVGAKMSETAERSRLGVGTMETAFAGLSTLLGAGIAVGFAAHFLDETARVLIELKHLESQTNISIQTLAGLRIIAQQQAVPFEGFQTSLFRLSRAQVVAVEGNQHMRASFKELGVSVEELRHLNSEDLFFRVAKGIQESSNTAVANAAAQEVMGRQVRVIIPLMREHGAGLREATAAAAAHSGITDRAAESAAKWHAMTAQLAQAFQSFMIPVLEVTIPLIKALQTGFEALAFGIIEAFEAAATAIVGTFVALKGVGKLLADVQLGNFDKIPADAKAALGDTVNAFKAGGTDLKNNWTALRSEMSGIWAKPIEAKGPELESDLSGLQEKLGKSTLVQEWREQLDQMRDAQVGFHELSKAEEAGFWKSKLDLARSSPAIYRQVYHEYVTAEREARHQSLSEELSSMEQRVAAERSGSIERVTILREEADYLKSIGAEESSEYRRVQQQLVTAQREAATEDSRVFTKRVEDELAEESHNAAAKLAIIQHATTTAELFYENETDIYKFLQEEKQRATRELAEEQRSIQATEADAVKSHEQTMLDIRRAAIDTQASIGLISESQRLVAERAVITEEIALERQALETKAALYKDQPVEYERVQKQLLALTDRYNKQMAQSDNEELRNRAAGWQKFGGQIGSDFGQAVNKMVLTGRGLTESLAQSWNHMVASLAAYLAEMVAKWTLSYALMELITHVSVLRNIATHLHEISSKIAAETAANTQRIAQATATNTALTVSDAAYTTAHLAGAVTRSTADIASIGVSLPATLATNVAKVTSDAGVAGAAGFSSVMVALPFPANIAVAPGVMASAISATLANIPLAAAERGAILDRDTLLHAHKGELIVPEQYVSTVLASVTAVGGEGGAAVGGVGGLSSSISREISTSNSTSEFISSRPKTNLSLPAAIAAQFHATKTGGLVSGIAEKGGILERDMNIAGHAKEMMLPANISTGLQNAISTGGFNPPPSLTQNFSTVGGAGTSGGSSSTVHHHSVTVAPTIEYHQHGGEGPDEEKLRSIVIQSVKTGIRRGQFDLGGVIGR